MLALETAIQEALLGRPLCEVLTSGERGHLAGQRVLVTGAGGSIGGELTRQIAACAPARLILFDHAEYALFRIEREIRQRFPSVPLDAVLGDVSRPEDVSAAFQLAPQVVYHAAAYKHVVLTERSIVPAARTNILGTCEVVRAARAAQARLLLISSDKAAEPRSVMGASKRFAELIALAQATPAFRPAAVRFGNILGSSGSLAEIVADCVRHGRPVPITHPDATRFFMTAQEAVSLVLKADLMARRPEIFWLDMGEAVRIGDLVPRLIDLLTPAGAAPVGVDLIGLRPGEKMREDLTNQGLKMRRTTHPRIWSARPRADVDALESALHQLRRAIARGDALGVLDALHQAVIDFSASTGARTAALATVAPALEPMMAGA